MTAAIYFRKKASWTGFKISHWEEWQNCNTVCPQKRFFVAFSKEFNMVGTVYTVFKGTYLIKKFSDLASLGPTWKRSQNFRAEFPSKILFHKRFCYESLFFCFKIYVTVSWGFFYWMFTRLGFFLLCRQEVVSGVFYPNRKPA